MFRKNVGGWLIIGLISSQCFAADFTAHVDKSSVGVGDTVDLRLELSDGQPQGEPDLSDLAQSFQVIGQRQSSITQVINGASSNQTIWEISLAPTEVGQLTVPPISVSTAQGELKTQPVPLIVSEASATVATKTSATRERGISFTAEADHSQVYRNEPIRLTYRLVASQPIRNIQFGEMKVKDALVEPQGQPEVRSETVQGRRQKVLHMTYLITPMKDGELKIPPLVVRGEMPSTRMDSPMPEMPSAFGGDDVLAEMQNMMNRFGGGSGLWGGLSQGRPVTLASNSLHVGVLPAIAGMDPWLPATQLRLTESWSGGDARVGTPLTRTITTEVTGLNSSLLPGFDDQMVANENYKVYSDRPETSDKPNGRAGNKGTRKDILTIVPQKSGEIHLPELKVVWFDTNSRSTRIASLPARVLNVLPGLANAVRAAPASDIQGAPAADVPQAAIAPAKLLKDGGSDSKRWRYGLLLLMSIAVAVILKERQRAKVFEAPGKASPSVRNPLRIPNQADLDRCVTVEDLSRFLQSYFEAKWDLPSNSSLTSLILGAKQLGIPMDYAAADRVRREIEDALYAGKREEIDLELSKKRIAKVLFTREKRNPRTGEPNQLPELNPS